MTDRDLQVAFHSRADFARYRNRMTNPFLHGKERSLASRVAEKARIPVGELLEIGCGEGSNLVYLAEALSGWRLSGIDFSAEKISFLRQALPQFQATVGDALNLPFADATFDIVLCRDLLHHVDQQRDRAVAEAVRVLRPGGRLVVFEANGRKLLARLFMLFFSAERGASNSTPESLDALGRRHGGARLEFVECSLFVRAVGFVIGWPGGVLRLPAAALYGLAWLWERTMEMILPRGRWTYMMLSLDKAAA